MKLHGALIFSSITAFNEIVQDCQASWQKEKTTYPSANKQYYVRFRNLIISPHHFAIVVSGSTMTAAATTVQAHATANGFNDRFAKAKVHPANNQTSSCTTHNLCQGTRQNRFKHIGMQAYQLYWNDKAKCVLWWSITMLDMARIVSRDGKDFCLDCNEYVEHIREHMETHHQDPNQT